MTVFQTTHFLKLEICFVLILVELKIGPVEDSKMTSCRVHDILCHVTLFKYLNHNFKNVEIYSKINELISRNSKCIC